MARAADLVLGTALAVQDVAERCGYGDAFRFSRAFRRFHGRAPSTYRQHFAAREV